MEKKSITKKVPISRIFHDPTNKRIAQFVNLADFFAKGIEEYGHYTNPPVYQQGDKYFLLGLEKTMGSLITLDCEEVLVDVIDISGKDISKYLLTYQYQESYGERCLAEFMKICQELTKTDEGKEWLKNLTGTRDKQKQYSVLFDISETAAKYYLKLIQKGNEEFLELLLDKKNGGLYKAYTECCKAENKPQNAPDSNESSACHKDAAEYPEEPTAGPEPIVDNSPKSEPSLKHKGPSNPAKGDASVEPKPDDGSGTEIKDFRDDLEIYRKQQESGAYATEGDLAIKVIVLINDGSQFELAGKIDLKVNGLSIRNSEQLRKRPDGTWRLPDHNEPIQLIIYPEAA